MASRSLGSLTVDVIAKVGGFTKGMTQAERQADKSSKEIERRLKKLGKGIDAAFQLAAAGIVAGTTALVAGVKAAVDRADDLSKAAQKIGITTEALSALAYAAQLADVDLGTLQGGLARLTKFQNEAAQGTEKNVALFEALGITFQNVDGSLRDTEAVFRDFAKVFQALPDGANKTALALDVFGKSGANLIPLLNGGADGLDEMREKAERLGIVVSTETGKSAEEFNDRLEDLKLAATGLATALAVELLPDLNELTAELQNGTASGDGFAETATNVANGIRGIAAVAGAAYDTIKLLALGIVNIAASTVEFAASLSLLPGADKAQRFYGDIAAVTGAGATDAARSLLGNESSPVQSGITGSGVRGGRGRAEGETSKADLALQLQYNEALNGYRDRTEKATAAASGRAAAERAVAAAAKAAADAEKAADEAFLATYDELQDLRRKEREEVAEEAKARKEAKAIVDQTLADIAFETELLGMNNAARETAIALRYANVNAASAEGKAIAEAIDELQEKAKRTEGIEFARDATKGLFEDLTDGVGSARDAVDDFFDNLRAKAFQVLADKLFDGLFDSFSGGGEGGGGSAIGNFLGSLFGGARAGGGPVYPGKAYLVGEEGPELIRPMGAGMVSTAGETARMGRGGPQIINNFNMPGRYDLRTQAQITTDAGRSTQRALARGTA